MLGDITEDKYKKQGLSYEKRGAMRLEQEKPVLDAFWSRLDNQHLVRNSRMDKAHDLNIYKYFKFLLEQCPNFKMNDEQLSDVLPWNQEVIEKCHN